MKKTILAVICILLSVSFIQAQEETEPKLPLFVDTEIKNDSISKSDSTDIEEKKNEIKLNLLPVIFKTLELLYERKMSDNMGLGISIGYGFGVDPELVEDFTSRYYWSIMPYYRFYFGKKGVKGFFIEANTAILKVRDIEEFYNVVYQQTDYKKFDRIVYGSGFATGAKFLTSKNFIGEIYLGVGRVFNAENLYLSSGISIGKRF